MVQQLHRVQLRAVAGQKLQLDPVGMTSHPGADQLGPVHRMAIHDQMDLPAGAIAQQPTQKVDEDPAGERPGEEAEPQHPSVGDRADHVDPESLAGPFDHRGLAHRRPGASRRRIRADPHLIQPQHQPAFAAGLGADGGIVGGQPAAHRGRVLLQGPALGPLGAEPPATQIAAHGGAGQQEAIAAGDQLSDRIASP
jgi:hypothetical protein